MSTRAPGGGMPASRLPGGRSPVGRRVRPIFKPVRAFPGHAVPLPGRPSNSAIASLIMSITGLLFLIPALGGIVLGTIELGHINRGESPAKGRRLAQAGIIIGAVVLALDIVATIIILARGS